MSVNTSNACSNLQQVQAQNVTIQHVDKVETLKIIQDEKSLWTRAIEGASWSAGASIAGFVVIKVCEVAHRTFIGAQAGSATGSAFGPTGAVAGMIIGGSIGAASGIIV